MQIIYVIFQSNIKEVDKYKFFLTGKFIFKGGEKLKSGLKTLGMWLIIAVIFIVLLTTIMDNSSTKMNYSELVTKIEASEVKEIEKDTIQKQSSKLLG